MYGNFRLLHVCDICKVITIIIYYLFSGINSVKFVQIAISPSKSQRFLSLVFDSNGNEWRRFL